MRQLHTVALSLAAIRHAHDKIAHKFTKKSVDKCIKCVECGYSVAGFEKNEVVIKKNAILEV